MIGVFDSGLGGMSVVTALRRLLPQADILYFADSGRAPYGPRPLEEVRGFSEQITNHLREAGADMVVVACNSASAAALHQLRARHPDLPFVGMEPAVKPAVAATSTGIIGVLTTAATFQGELFASVVDRFAIDVRVRTAICHGWVELVEAGNLEGHDVERLVRTHVQPLIDDGADTLVLGCTHYPFLADVISKVAGGDVTLIDPAPAVARQASRIATDIGADVGSGNLRVETSGDPVKVAAGIRHLTGLAPPTIAVTLPPA
jgi:glutamate racemase